MSGGPSHLPGAGLRRSRAVPPALTMGLAQGGGPAPASPTIAPAAAATPRAGPAGAIPPRTRRRGLIDIAA